jgi:hypothetical protein
MLLYVDDVVGEARHNSYHPVRIRLHLSALWTRWRTEHSDVDTSGKSTDGQKYRRYMALGRRPTGRPIDQPPVGHAAR